MHHATAASADCCFPALQTQNTGTICTPLLPSTRSLSCRVCQQSLTRVHTVKQSLEHMTRSYIAKGYRMQRCIMIGVTAGGEGVTLDALSALSLSEAGMRSVHVKKLLVDIEPSFCT